MIHRHTPNKFEALMFIVPPKSFELSPIESALLDSKKPFQEKIMGLKDKVDVARDKDAVYYYKSQDSPIIKIDFED